MDGRLLGASARLSLVASLCSFRSMSGTVPVRPVPVLLSVRSAIPRAPTLPAYHRVPQQQMLLQAAQVLKTPEMLRSPPYVVSIRDFFHAHLINFFFSF